MFIKNIRSRKKSAAPETDCTKHQQPAKSVNEEIITY